MNNVWKISSIVMMVLLVISSVLAENIWRSLNTTRGRLANTEAQLTITTGELNTTRGRLANTEAQLTITTGELNTTKAKLGDTKAQLDVTKTQLTATEAQLDLVIIQVATQKAELANVRTQLQTANDEKSQLLSSYVRLRNNINTRFGFTQQDRQSFITPSDTAVSAKVQEITTPYTGETSKVWNDYSIIYQWVVKNILYSYDSYTPLLPSALSGTFTWREDFWRMPAETLADKTGDCEDMALLLASMIKSYNKNNFAIWVITISSSVPGVPGHAAVVFPVQGGGLTILDPAGKYYTGMQYGSLRSESASLAINNWSSYWEGQIPGAFVDRVFSENLDRQFSTTADFITWLSQN
ncbi:MAG: hypothetical protein HY530_02280 [Chloroflexi bacterium]|nr:hypothetical protein [Chloroflexota bacterium]